MYKTVFFAIQCLLSTNRYAKYDSVLTGKISQIKVTTTNNYSYRIVLEGTPKFCGNSHVWGYLNASDKNYAANVNTLLKAKLQGADIKISSQQKNPQNYCHIGFVSRLGQ